VTVDYGGSALIPDYGDNALILQPPANLVVVDESNRIRGQYDAADRDEMDRLILEMKIMLKQY